MEVDISVLQQVVSSTWKKEDELKELKSEVAALERKIQLSLTPQTAEQKPDESSQTNEPPHSIASATATHTANQTNAQSAISGESDGQAATHSQNPNILVVTVPPIGEPNNQRGVKL
ncbi:hypothetical protein [Bacteroides graminisolvens]|uniref:Putative DNA methylase n=1 Tax=Bacteroides graminisolvens DSM 19988 = JCM 15093 TaxID=1121097 RepID=A0A069D2E8_9BACE|nr:putative DNA methylase [Bacteroides graminisolvens DSM 19988 = JCM 15093]